MNVKLPNGAVLPMTISGEQAAELAGLSRSTAYEDLRNDRWPTTTLSVGGTRHRRVATVPWLRHLGIPFEFEPAAAT